MRYVLGLDPSVSRTGYVILSETGDVVMAGTMKEPGLTGIERIVAFRAQFGVLLASIPETPSLVAIEGYAYSNAFSLATLVELGTTLRLHLVDNRIPFIVPQPNQVKSFVQLKGKTKPTAKVKEIWGWKAPNHDVADAYVIARIALATLRPSMATKDHEIDVIAAVRKGFALAA